jgi:hypothetical protein
MDKSRQSVPLARACRCPCFLNAAYTAPASHVTVTTPQQIQVAISATFHILPRPRGGMRRCAVVLDSERVDRSVQTAHERSSRA